MTGPDAGEHRQLRELLGAYALGGLPEDASNALRAHLDGCATCRAELAEIAPLAKDLRLIHPDALALQPSPPADLGERIRAGVAAERAMVEARARREQSRRRAQKVMGAAAAVTVIAVALGLGTALGRSTAPAPEAQPRPSTSSPALPVEQVAVRNVDTSVSTQQAQIVAHTWGVEAKFIGTGFRDGQVYRAAFRTADGRLLPAGEFLGTGAKELKCNMQSALLRPDTTGFVVTDEAGTQVLTADL